MSCTKDVDSVFESEGGSTVTRAYSIKYDFVSKSTAQDFIIFYVDGGHQQVTAINQQSEWVCYFVGYSGDSVNVAVNANTLGASISLSISVDGSVVVSDYQSGVGTLASSNISYTLQ